MRIECENCGDLVETTAKTIVAPFVCTECDCDCGTCKPDATPTYDPCDTATVENTTLLIEDLQQQLHDERATVIALETELTQMKEVYNHVNDELVIARQNFLEASKQIDALTTRAKTAEDESRGYQQQILNQASVIKEQEGHIDQDLSAIVNLLNERSRLTIQCSRQRNSITMYQEQEEKLAGEVTGLKYSIEVLKERITFLREKIAGLRRHPIREYFRNAWSS
jgi:chromosome segregation ATPase